MMRFFFLVTSMRGSSGHSRWTLYRLLKYCSTETFFSSSPVCLFVKLNLWVRAVSWSTLSILKVLLRIATQSGQYLANHEVEQIKYGLTIACIAKPDTNVVIVQFSECCHVDRFTKRPARSCFDTLEHILHHVIARCTGDLKSELSDAGCAPESAVGHVYVDNEVPPLHIELGPEVRAH